MSTSELDSRNITFSMKKSMENLVISSQDAIGQSISQALTYSGVITQHANQIIQETRNVSRPPSPAIRNIETGLDILENDKPVFQGSSTSLHVPSHSSADSASISSATDLVTVANSPPKGDKASSPPSGPRSVEGGGGRAKKKSWYNSLYPTYKSKSEDFKRLFKDLPDDERLIVDYSCALQKDILVHGRLYASQNYLCFYASIFGWETSLTLRWKDVTAITKEKTALVIPNAILVCTGTNNNFLTSFSGRDKAYLMLFRIWQNALMDQTMTSHEIWQWVHSCYGEELGFNSDDEGYGRDFPEEAVVLPTDNASEDLVESSMEASGAGDSRDEAQPSRPRHGHARDCDPPLVTNGEAGYKEEAGDALPTDMSDTSDSEPDKPHNGGDSDKCTASHEGKELLREQFPFNVDQLFTMIFTNSKFNLELLAARGTTDYVQAPWQAAGGLKCRQLSYTLSLTSGPIGPKEVQVTETQVMNNCSKPGVLYSIDSTSENAGIPYADYFSVKVHYCLQRVAEHATSLVVIAHIHYKKTMWPMVKGFLEKNTMSGLEEYTRLMRGRLRAEAGRAGAAPARAHRRHRRPKASPQETIVAAAMTSPVVGVLAPRGSVSRPARAWGTERWLVGSLVLLLLINALLYWKLYHADVNRTLDMDHLYSRLSAAGGEGGEGGEGEGGAWWARVREQARAQRGELRAWRAALDRTRAHLMQTEQALIKLLETIKPSLEAGRAAADQDSPRKEL